MDSHASDDAIVLTANDAWSAKFAAVDKGYYWDAFLPAFATVSHGNRQSHRHVQPIIKRGTHARVCCMDRAVTSFVELVVARRDPHSPIQVVVLGCGKDTTFFRHQEGRLTSVGGDEKNAAPNTNSEAPSSSNKVHWFEVDHPAVIQEKASIIRANPSLFNSSVEKGTSNCHFRIKPDIYTSYESECTLLGHDLRNDPEGLMLALASNGLRADAPVLFLLECVLMYLPEIATKSLIAALPRHFPQACLCLYEPILGSDPFGRVMEQNLRHANVAQNDSCLVQTRTLAQQMQKLRSAGFNGNVVGCDMWAAYESIVTATQRAQANRSEFLDELEEWILIMRHYCFVVACTNAASGLGEQLGAVGPQSVLGFATGKCELM
jgi:O-methyltransferase involved in polyketide biosynthesis